MQVNLYTRYINSTTGTSKIKVFFKVSFILTHLLPQLSLALSARPPSSPSSWPAVESNVALQILLACSYLSLTSYSNRERLTNCTLFRKGKGSGTHACWTITTQPNGITKLRNNNNNERNYKNIVMGGGDETQKKNIIEHVFLCAGMNAWKKASEW